MKTVVFALLMTISGSVFAVVVDPNCVKAIGSQPFCVSHLNSRLYCARNWFRRDPVGDAAYCYYRLGNKDLTDKQLKEICIGDGPLAVSSSPADNKSLCDE